MTQLNFNKSIKTYQRYHQQQKKIEQELLKQIEKNNLGPRKILELGCGLGELTKKVGVLYPSSELLALDASTSMITTAKELNPWDHIDYQVGDFDQEEMWNKIPIRSIDLIYSSSAFQWSQNIQALFTRLSSKLKSPGLFSFTIILKNNFNEFETLLNQEGFHFTDSTSFLEMTTILDLLAHLDFEVTYQKEIRETVTYASFMDILRMVQGTGTQRQLNKPLLPKMIKKLTENSTNLKVNGRRFPLTWHYAVISLRKR